MKRQLESMKSILILFEHASIMVSDKFIVNAMENRYNSNLIDTEI